MRVGQVVTNLVENAVKHSSPGSKIAIEAQRQEDHLVINVIDKGEGIAPEILPKLFDRFYQAESIVASGRIGTGLGLSICKGIVEAHAGRIWVESKPGEGATFSFSLSQAEKEEKGG